MHSKYMFRAMPINLTNSQNACIEENHNFRMYKHEQIVLIICIKDLRFSSVLCLTSSISANVKVFIHGNVYISIF